MSPDAESHASATVASDSALHPQGSCTCHAILPFEWPSKSNGTSWSLEASPVNEQLMNSGLAKPFAPFPPCQNWHRVLKPCRGKSRFSNSGPHKSHWWPRVINFSENFCFGFPHCQNCTASSTTRRFNYFSSMMMYDSHLTVSHHHNRLQQGRCNYHLKSLGHFFFFLSAFTVGYCV